MGRLIIFKFFKAFELKNSSIFQIEQFRIFDNFLNQSIITIWKMVNFPNLKFWNLNFLFNLENYQNFKN